MGLHLIRKLKTQGKFVCPYPGCRKTIADLVAFQSHVEKCKGKREDSEVTSV